MEGRSRLEGDAGPGGESVPFCGPDVPQRWRLFPVSSAGGRELQAPFATSFNLNVPPVLTRKLLNNSYSPSGRSFTRP